MDLNDVFRHFFGFRSPSSRGGNDVTDDGDDQDGFREFNLFTHPPPHGGTGRGPPTGIGEDPEGEGGEEGQLPSGGSPFPFDHEVNQMFRHFEEMFRNFGLADFPQLDIPNMEPPASGKGASVSPRDQMLKEPSDTMDRSGSRESATAPPSKEPLSWFDELRKGRSSLFNPSRLEDQPSNAKKEDSDLDDVVRQGEIDRIFSGGSSDLPGSRQRRPEIRSFSRSTSIVTIRKPDGTIETRWTDQDGRGNSTTTVTTREGAPPLAWGPGQETPGALPQPRRPFGPPHEERSDDPLFQRFFGPWFKK